MNSINIPNSNNEKYIQLTNNIIYQNIHQYYCPSCHSPICNCYNNFLILKKVKLFTIISTQKMSNNIILCL